MKILYNYKPFDQPRIGLFHTEDETNNIKEFKIIGKYDTGYATQLKPYSDKLGSDPTMLLPIGLHKSRLIRWKTNQLELFD